MKRRGFLKLILGFSVGSLTFGANSFKAADAAGKPKTVIALNKLPVGSAYTFKSKIGAPAMVLRTKKGVFAYSLICTHLGCEVALDQSLLVCPCHGSQFDPLHGGAVLSGPAPAPLSKIKVAISGKNVVEL
jgi:cytochrome b6-f complex iron-sulfur subunit